MAYRYQYYTPYKKRKARAALKRLKQRALLVCGIALAVFLAAVTINQVAGVSLLPTWEQLYEGFGLQAQPVQATVPFEEEAVRDCPTKIHYIDVGQADATLIEQSGEFCLIDAGDTAHKEELIAYLKSAGVEKIKLLVMTHEHADHIGGMVSVMEQFEVEQMLLPDFSHAAPPDGYNILRTLELMDLQGIPEVTAQPGDTYAIGSGVLTVLGNGIQTEEKNNTSTVLRFDDGGNGFLFCGDAEEAATSVLRTQGVDVKTQVYKAAHHGASDSNSQAWLNAVSPEWVIVSCGKDNSFGHPHAAALEAFAKVGAQVWRTDEQGSIVIGVDAGGALHIATENGTTENNAATDEQPVLEAAA